MALKKKDENTEKVFFNEMFSNLSKIYVDIYNIILNINYKDMPEIIDRIYDIRENYYSNIMAKKLKGRRSLSAIKNLLIQNEISRIVDDILYIGMDMMKRPIPFRVSNIFRDDSFRMFFNGMSDLILNLQNLFDETGDEKLASILKNSSELEKMLRNLLIELYKNEKDLDPSTLEQLSYFFTTSGEIISCIEKTFIILRKS
ncbi:MAG: hypothetical protein ACP5RZ_03175 [Thermoplasmata archaeon]